MRKDVVSNGLVPLLVRVKVSQVWTRMYGYVRVRLCLCAFLLRELKYNMKSEHV